PLTTGGASPVTETLASASLLTVGLSGGSAFVGLNAGTSEAIGFNVTIDSLALAVIKSTSTTDARSWVGLSASVNSAAVETPASASLLTVGVSGGTAFVGLNAETSEAIGFNVAIGSLALAVIKPSLTTDTRSWVGLSASASSAAFVAPASLPFHVTATNL